MSATIDLYTTRTCPYCIKAKKLLDLKACAYNEIDVTDQPEQRQQLIEKANGQRTVPQIFINGQHIGGCDDLYALDAKGELDPLLAA